MADNGNAGEQAIFRTKVFGGFEKTDVLSYIQKIENENNEKVVDLEDNLKKLREAGDVLRSQVGSFEEKVGLLENQLSEKGKKIEEMTSHIDSLKKKVSDSAIKKQELREEVESLKAINSDLTKKADDYKAKADEFEGVKASIADILISAKEQANKVIVDAGEEADKITGRAYAATGKITDEMLKLKGEISSVRDNLVGLTDAFSVRLDEIEKVIDEIIEERLAEPGDEEESFPKASYEEDKENEEEPEGDAVDEKALREAKLKESFFR